MYNIDWKKAAQVCFNNTFNYKRQQEEEGLIEIKQLAQVISCLSDSLILIHLIIKTIIRTVA